MRRSIVTALGTAVIASWAASVGATDQQGRQQKPSGENAAKDQVTVDGCLSVNPAARTYILTVKPDELAATAPGGDATTTITYQLVGGEGLQKHVGDRVEVKGRVEPESTATAEAESERSGPPANPPAGNAKPKVETKTEAKIRAQVLRVQSFRFVEANCKPTQG